MNIVDFPGITKFYLVVAVWLVAVGDRAIANYPEGYSSPYSEQQYSYSPANYKSAAAAYYADKTSYTASGPAYHAVNKREAGPYPSPSNGYSYEASTYPTPVSYTHLTLPTIYSV